MDDALLSQTAVDDLRNVVRPLRDLVGWINLGIELGLLQPTLESIQHEQHNRVADCRREMLIMWLKQSDNVADVGHPSWQVLKTALRSIGESTIAEKLPPAPR